MKNLACVILAAGEGTRMKSRLAKVLHPVGGTPMLGHVLALAESLSPRRIVVVAGRDIRHVRAFVGRRATVVEQKRRLGSGHAVMQARNALGRAPGAVVVLYGDMPLLKPETVADVVTAWRRSGTVAALLAARVEMPDGYGRVIRSASGDLARIVEDAAASPGEKEIHEINTGAACFDARELFSALKSLRPNPVKREFFLTDAIDAIASRRRFVVVMAKDALEALGINSRQDLAAAERVMNARALRRLMAAGVTIQDPGTTFVGPRVRIGPDTVIHPNTVIEGPAKIGRDCRIGPFARIRENVTIGDGVCVGNFVEITRSRIGRGTMVKHLTYLGDARVGAGVNIGAGTITANFDGRRKNPTVIGDGARIGVGTMLVAPVRVGARAVTGAGAVLTRGKNVPAGATVAGVPAKVLAKGSVIV